MKILRGYRLFFRGTHIPLLVRMINSLRCPCGRSPSQYARPKLIMSPPTVSCMQKHLEKQVHEHCSSSWPIYNVLEALKTFIFFFVINQLHYEQWDPTTHNFSANLEHFCKFDIKRSLYSMLEKDDDAQTGFSNILIIIMTVKCLSGWCQSNLVKPHLGTPGIGLNLLFLNQFNKLVCKFFTSTS